MKIHFKKFLFIPAIILAGFIASVCFAGEKTGALKVHFINVGDGDAILVQFPDQTNLLIDAGREEYAGKIIQYLQSRGVSRINKAVLTHPHKNHFGSFSAIIDTFPVEQFYINGDEKNADFGYAELLDKIAALDIPSYVVMEGDVIPAADKDISIKILHPDGLSSSANGNSIVTWLTYGQTGFLFTADIGASQQDEIIRPYPQIGSADCIQVPHHGKDVSDLFARFFGRKIFVASTGIYQNAVPDLRPLAKLKGKVLRTDRVGTIIVESNGEQVQVKSP